MTRAINREFWIECWLETRFASIEQVATWKEWTGQTLTNLDIAMLLSPLEQSGRGSVALNAQFDFGVKGPVWLSGRASRQKRMHCARSKMGESKEASLELLDTRPTFVTGDFPWLVSAVSLCYLLADWSHQSPLRPTRPPQSPSMRQTVCTLHWPLVIYLSLGAAGWQAYCL